MVDQRLKRLCDEWIERKRGAFDPECGMGSENDWIERERKLTEPGTGIKPLPIIHKDMNDWVEKNKLDNPKDPI